MNVQEFIALLLRYVIVIIASTHFAAAGTRDPNTPDEKYVEFGQKFSSVARIRAVAKVKDKETDKDVITPVFGSAVLIRPHWALTAAHVLENATDASIVVDGGKAHELSHVVIHKNFREEVFGFYDLALCYSDADFEASFYPELYKGADEVNKAVTIAGYGLHGTFISGCVISDGKKRAGHNRIDNIERGLLVCTPSIGIDRFPLEFMISPGDSGGGMFIGNKLAGINSILMAKDGKPNGTYGDETACTRISLYVDWIEEQIAAHELNMQARATLKPMLFEEKKD